MGFTVADPAAKRRRMLVLPLSLIVTTLVIKTQDARHKTPRHQDTRHNKTKDTRYKTQDKRDKTQGTRHQDTRDKTKDKTRQDKTKHDTRRKGKEGVGRVWKGNEHTTCWDGSETVPYVVRTMFQYICLGLGVVRWEGSGSDVFLTDPIPIRGNWPNVKEIVDKDQDQDQGQDPD